MKDKIKVSDFVKGTTDTMVKKIYAVFNLDDDALNFSSLEYSYLSNWIKSSELFEAILKSDLKRIENFKEKFDLEKFNQRSKKYKKLVHYWHKEFDENFFNLIKQLKKYIKIPYIKIPYIKIPQDFLIDASEMTDNLTILILYLSFSTSTARQAYCFDMYFDRFNFDYDIDTKTIKKEIDVEISGIFIFGSNLVTSLKGTLTIEMVEKLLKEFRSGRKLSPTKKPKYKLVAEYITIIEKHFNLSTGIQRIACELAGVIHYSFSAWKNAKNNAGEKANLDTYQKWTKEKIPSKKVEELKTDVANYLKSS